MREWQKLLGEYDSGLIMVDVLVREGGGGECYLAPQKGCPAREIGRAHV